MSVELSICRILAARAFEPVEAMLASARSRIAHSTICSIRNENRSDSHILANYGM